MSKAPKLRFKKFSGDWEEKKLQNVSDVRDGTHDSPKYVTEGYPFVTSKNLMKNGKIDFSDISYITEEDYININKRSKVDVGDILFGMIGTIGNPVIVEQDGFAIKNVALIKEKDKLLNRYLIQVLKSSVIDRQFYKLNTGGTQKFIGLGMIRDLSILIPSIEEQEKIAFFFSLIDDKISLQGEKVEALKDYKKGMMQKIFSRELRFKDDDGRDYPEWEEKKLDDLIKIKSNRNKNSVVELVLSVSNTKGFITQSEQFEDRIVASSDISNYKIVEKDDFAFNPARINVGSIARLKLYDKGIISPMYICFKCLNSLESDYLEYFLMTHSFDVQMKKKLEGSVRQTLSSEALGEIVIDLPCLNEQKKIGEYLSTINDKLVKEQEKLDYLNEYKKGLLQQMFV